VLEGSERRRIPKTDLKSEWEEKAMDREQGQPISKTNRGECSQLDEFRSLRKKQGQDVGRGVD